MKIHKNIAISETGFVFNPLNGDSFTTNIVGLEIIKLMQSNVSNEKIIKHIVDKFNIDKITAEKDLEDFLLQLNYHQLIDENE